jgi:hypothetical protein
LHVEVDEEASRCSLDLHVGQQLGGMNGHELFDRLYLSHQSVFDQEVNEISFPDLYSFVFQWKRDFSGMRDLSKLQLAAEATVVTGADAGGPVRAAP